MGTKSNKSSKSTVPLVALTPHAVRHLPKPRAGFDRFAEDLLSLYASNPGTFGKDIDVKAVRKALAAYAALGADEMAAQAQIDKIRETRLLNGSTVWTAMLAIYGRGSLAGRANADIDHGIAAFAAFMKNGPRKGKATTVPVTT